MRCRHDNPTPGCCSSEPIARKREPPIVDSAAGYWQRCPRPLAIPRPPIAPGAIKIRRFGSTVSTWKRRGLRSVVTLELFQQDRQQLLCTIEKLKTRVQILAAAIRLLLALLRASAFRLTGERLPEGDTKASILRAVVSAQPALSLRLVLRIIGLPASRYHAWRRIAVVCGLDDRSPVSPNRARPAHRRRGCDHQRTWSSRRSSGTCPCAL